MVKLGTFNGSGNWNIFRAKFETCAKYSNWDNEDKLMHLMTVLDWSAADIISNCHATLTYNSLLDKLQRRYGSEHQYESYRYQLENRRQKSGESLQALCDDLEKLAARGLSGLRGGYARNHVHLACIPESDSR